MSTISNDDNNIFVDIIQEKELHGCLLEKTQVICSVVKKTRAAKNIFSLSLNFSAMDLPTLLYEITTLEWFFVDSLFCFVVTGIASLLLA